jgi:hypothetical protein
LNAIEISVRFILRNLTGSQAQSPNSVFPIAIVKDEEDSEAVMAALKVISNQMEGIEGKLILDGSPPIGSIRCCFDLASYWAIINGLSRGKEVIHFLFFPIVDL